MASYNRIIMMGNLTRDPELKQLASGQGVCRFSMASNRQFKNRQTGALAQEVCFIDVDVWGAQAESCKQYLLKGRAVLVEGRLKLDSWQDAEGNKRSKHSIVADRVTFLASGANAGMEDGGLEPEEGLTPFDAETIKSSPALSNVMQQVEKVKKTVKPATAPRVAQQNSFDGGELNFKDEAPFEDDLPF